MKWAIEKKTGVGLAVAALVLLLVAGLLYRNARNFIEAREWVSHTHEVLAQLAATLSAVADAQTEASGYVITGQEVFLEPYQAAISGIGTHLDQIKSLTADNPRQQHRMAILESALARRLDSLKEIIDLRKQEGFEAARERVATGISVTQMNEVQAVIAEMKQEEEDLLRVRTLYSRLSTWKTTLTFSCVIFFEFLLLGLIYYLLRRD